DRPGAEIDWLGAVVPLPLVADLHLVAVLVLVRQAAEEDAAVEVLAVGDALALEHEVRPLPLGLQVAGAVRDVQPALRRDRELRLVPLAGEDLPAGQVFAVEDRLQPGRAERHGPKNPFGVGNTAELDWRVLLPLSVHFLSRIGRLRAARDEFGLAAPG